MTARDPLLAVAFELVSAACRFEDGAEFVAYARRRLQDEVTNLPDAYHLAALLATLAGTTLTTWVDDTGRELDAVLQSIGLDVAQGNFET